MLPYDEAGSGEVVLLIHAGVADRSMWREHLEWLAQSGRATLVGNSFGAAVALRAAAVAPAAVSALVLISPPPVVLDPSPVLRSAWEAEESALERGDIDGAVAAVVAAWTQPNAPEALRERVASMQRRAFALQSAAGEMPEAADPLEQHPEVLAELQIPALLAAGEHDMTDFRDAAEQLADALPLARHDVITGAGHLAPLEAPHEFRQLLLDFLRNRTTRFGESRSARRVGAGTR